MDVTAAKLKCDTCQWASLWRAGGVRTQDMFHSLITAQGAYVLHSLQIARRPRQVFNFLCHASVCVCMWIMKFASALAHADMCNRGQLSTTLRARRCTHTRLQKSVALSAVPGSATLCHMLPCCFCHMQLRSRWQIGEKVKTTVVMDGRPHLFEHLWTKQWQYERLCMCTGAEQLIKRQ